MIKLQNDVWHRKKVIHPELCKRLISGNVDSFYKHKAESDLQNEMHRIPTCYIVIYSIITTQ